MSKYKRAVVFGCSHGASVDPVARRAIARFVADYRPHRVVHLGDFCDTAALRAGAYEREDVDGDIDAGLTFLAEMGVTDALCGNHEARLWKLQHDRNPLVAALSGRIIRELESACAQRGVRLVPWDGAFQCVRLGNYKLMHGYLYGENAARDHAEAHGNVIHAHTHRPAFATGRRDDHARGICVGTLTRRREMTYAQGRRATLSWGQAFVWGEYNEQVFHPNLCLGPAEEHDSSVWRLP